MECGPRSPTKLWPWIHGVYQAAINLSCLTGWYVFLKSQGTSQHKVIQTFHSSLLWKSAMTQCSVATGFLNRAAMNPLCWTSHHWYHCFSLGDMIFWGHNTAWPYYRVQPCFLGWNRGIFSHRLKLKWVHSFMFKKGIRYRISYLSAEVLFLLTGAIQYMKLINSITT
jgi:hypothetical protein